VTAIHLATQAVIAKGRKIAAHLLEAGEDDVEFTDGRFVLSALPIGAEPAEVAKAAYFAHRLPEGLAPGLEELVAFEPPNFTYPFGVHVAVVEVDPETGHARLVRMVAVDDCGTVLNPMLVEGQMHGGLAQGVGAALYEEVRFAPEGHQETASMISYLIPTAVELRRSRRIEWSRRPP
jgi:carbon-monoxide dehydrogenase large subunit